MPFSAFVAASLALNLSPGPDMTYVAARSLAQGRRSGIISALGISVGCLFHLAAATAGIAVLLRAVPQAYTAVRVIGAGYLVYLGVAMMRQASRHEMTVSVAPAGDWAVFTQGMVTNVLNPKVALFFLAFLPQFVDAARGPAAVQTLALGLYFNVQGTLVNVGVACLAGGARTAFRASSARRWLQRASGVVLIGLGARLALSRSN